MTRHQLAAESQVRLDHQIERHARQADALADEAAIARHPAASTLESNAADLQRILHLAGASRRGMAFVKHIIPGRRHQSRATSRAPPGHDRPGSPRPRADRPNGKEQRNDGTPIYLRLLRPHVRRPSPAHAPQGHLRR